MKSFTITTLGCKVNRYESEAISEQLIDQGWYVMDEGITADLCIINTCTVTQKAAMQSRQAARTVIRNHPGATVMVTGLTGISTLKGITGGQEEGSIDYEAVLQRILNLGLHYQAEWRG